MIGYHVHYIYAHKWNSWMVWNWVRISCISGLLWSHHIGKNNNEVPNLLSLFPKCWDSKSVPPHLVPMVHGIEHSDVPSTPQTNLVQRSYGRILHLGVLPYTGCLWKLQRLTAPPVELLAWVSGTQEEIPSKSQSAVIRVRASRTLELWTKPSSSSSSADLSSQEIAVQMELWPASQVVQLVWEESSSGQNRLPVKAAFCCIVPWSERRLENQRHMAKTAVYIYEPVITHLGNICLFPKYNALPLHNAWHRTTGLERHRVAGGGGNGSIQGKVLHLLTKLESHH